MNAGFLLANKGLRNGCFSFPFRCFGFALLIRRLRRMLLCMATAGLEGSSVPVRPTFKDVVLFGGNHDLEKHVSPAWKKRKKNP